MLPVTLRAKSLTRPAAIAPTSSIVTSRRSRASRLYQLVEMIDIRQLVENQRS
jgi:hypothetical protein